MNRAFDSVWISERYRRQIRVFEYNIQLWLRALFRFDLLSGVATITIPEVGDKPECGVDTNSGQGLDPRHL